MISYRVYCLDGMSRIVRAEPLEAGSDDDALRMARVVMGDCFKSEVWERDRLVGRLDGHAR
jgi:hypothetical protein